MAEHTVPGDAASHSIADGDLQARFDVMPGSGQQPATVRASGDIDLANAARFQAALTKAAATSSEITTGGVAPPSPPHAGRTDHHHAQDRRHQITTVITPH